MKNSNINNSKTFKGCRVVLTMCLSVISLAANAQVIIGDAIGTATDKTSVLLEFANTDNRGLILPYVTTLPSSPAPGTILLDATSSTQARVKFYNGSWTDLSGQDGDVSEEIAYQNTYVSREGNSKAIIGDVPATADGVLVLESKSKAMVLPIVTDVNNIPSPSPGMMVYVKGTNKRLAVFNGSKWSFWRP